MTNTMTRTLRSSRVSLKHRTEDKANT